MINKQTLFRLCILGLVLIIGMVIISGRGCPKRRRDVRIGSSNEWAGIAAPSSLTATAFSYSEIRLSWQDNSNNEDGFEIWRSTDSIDWGFAPISTTIVNTASYSDTGLSQSTTYYYRVRATNTIGDRSEWSNEVSATTSSIVQSLVWSSVAAGENHTIALTTDGTVWAWGRNDNWWQLGIGDTSVTSRTSPTLIASDFDYQSFTGVTAIFVGSGSNYNLALKTDGTLWSWGANGAGQLGIGDTATIEAPLQIGTDSDWLSVTAGYYHAIGIKSNNTLWAWGYNQDGQLGDGTYGTYNNRTTPGQSGTESDWASVAAGEYHAIALKNNNTLWVWGKNNYGQLGLGATWTEFDDGEGGFYWDWLIEEFKSSPTQIGTDSDWSKIAAGSRHTIALKSNNILWAWGWNVYGQLGDGTQTQRTSPRQIGTESDWTSVVAGQYDTIALKSNNTLWAWGYNNKGQLGDGTQTDRYTPRQIGAGSDWTSVAAGCWHTIGIKSNPDTDVRTLWVWGDNKYGQLGLGDSISRNIPCPLGSPTPPSSLIATPLGLSQIAITWTDNSNAEIGFKIESKLNTSGTYEEIATVGNNAVSWLDTSVSQGITYYYRVRAYNEFGNSSYSNEAYTAVSGNWGRISAGNYHTIGIKTNNTLWAWGSNGFGQLGDGTINNKTAPRQIGSDSDWSKIAAGGRHTIALKSNNTLWAWGWNVYGQLGDGTTTDRNTPCQVFGSSSDWFTIATGDDHTIALKTDSTLWAWGSNGAGQLGDGTTNNRTTPRQITSDSDWSNITAGSNHTIGLKSVGTLWAWGSNGSGQLGDGTTDMRTTPRQIGTESDWTSVSAGYRHAFGIKTNNTLWAWGSNGAGQLGDGTTNNRTTPRQITSDSDWSNITAGSNHTIGLKSVGILWAWGSNGSGQLGDGTINNRTTPRQITSDSDWTSVAAGWYHSLGIKTNNTLRAWGENTYGQLGLGDTINRYVPTLVGE